MSYKPEISSLVGLWTYRSFIADPDLATAFNDLEFGRANIKVDEAPFGIFRGRIYDTGWALELNGSIQYGTPFQVRFQGKGIVGGEEWIYDYLGYVVAPAEWRGPAAGDRRDDRSDDPPLEQRNGDRAGGRGRPVDCRPTGQPLLTASRAMRSRPGMCAIGILSRALRRDRRGRRPRRCGDRAGSTRRRSLAPRRRGCGAPWRLRVWRGAYAQRLAAPRTTRGRGGLPRRRTLALARHTLLLGEAKHPSTTRRSSTHWARDGGLTADGLMPCSCGRPSPEGRPSTKVRRWRPSRRRIGGDGRVLTTQAAGGGTMSLNAAFLVDRMGRRATLAPRLCARVTYLDRLVGLAVLFTSPPATDGLTLVEACEEGWWYSFAVSGPRRLVVLMSDSDLLKMHRSGGAGTRWHESLARDASHL